VKDHKPPPVSGEVLPTREVCEARRFINIRLSVVIFEILVPLVKEKKRRC